MKTITKIMATSAAVVALFFTTNANAQSRKLGIGLNVGAGTSDAYGLAIGGDIRYQIGVDKQFSIPITAGYTHLSGKEIGNSGIDFPSYAYIPVKAGAKYFFNDSGSGVYGLAELGAGFGVTPDNAGTGFLYSPAIGYSWSNGIDLSAKYEGNTAKPDFTAPPKGYFGLRLAYGFKL